MDGWKSNMPNALLTFKMLPNLTQFFILRGEKDDKCICYDSCSAGDSDQHCVRDIGGLNCVCSNASSGQLQVDNRVCSCQPFLILLVSWNQVIERYTSESHRSIYPLWECNLKFDSVYRLTRFTAVTAKVAPLREQTAWLPLPWPTRAVKGLLPRKIRALVLLAYTGSAEWVTSSCELMIKPFCLQMSARCWILGELLMSFYGSDWEHYISTI